MLAGLDTRKRFAEAVNDITPEWFDIQNQTLSKYCESPIETMIGAAILWLDRLSDGIAQLYPLQLLSPNDWNEDYNHYKNYERLLIPQFKIGDYRADWAYRDRLGDDPLITFVECDGHDFHERTKQQATRDKKRDRIIQGTGPILRFTGSEIWANPFACAAQVLEFVDNRHVPASCRDEKRV